MNERLPTLYDSTSIGRHATWRSWIHLLHKETVLERQPMIERGAVRIIWTILTLTMILASGCSSGSASKGTESPAPSASANGLEMRASDADRIQDALTTSDPDEFLSVLDPMVRTSIQDASAVMLPAGSRVVLDRSTFREGEDVATVEAEVTGNSADGRYRLFLSRTTDQWLLYGTEKMR